MARNINRFKVSTLALGALMLRGSITCAAELYGIAGPTGVGGTGYDFVQVNTTTGQAAALFSFTLSSGFIPRDLAYDPPAERFVISGGATQSAPAIAVLNPITHAVTESPITGLPSGQESPGGVEYDPSLGKLLFTFGATNTFFQRQVAAIELTGAVQQISTVLNLVDCDEIAFDPVTNKLYVVDLNDTGVVAISDVFGSPTYSPLAPNPGDLNLASGSGFSEDGVLYVGRLGTTDLRKLSGTSFVALGPFGTTAEVVGLAFGTVPEPSTAALVALGLIGSGCFRRHR